MNQRHLQDYYVKFFPANAFCKLISRSWRENVLRWREVCIENVHKSYIRWQSVDCPDALLKLFRETNVEKIHTGAVFTNEPRFKKKGLVMTATQRELVFDCDVNDYDAFCLIDPNDIESCDRAWPIIALGMKIVKRLLQDAFGFEHFLLVYSGRRGAHLSVFDSRASELTDDVRSAIVDFMQPSENNGKLDYSKIQKSPGFKDIYSSHIEPFWLNFCILSVTDGGMGALDSVIDVEAFMNLFDDQRARKVVNTFGHDLWKILTQFADNSTNPAYTWSKLTSAVLHYTWPRLDCNVTKKRNHLSKSVFSVHPKTRRICVPINGNSMTFDPKTCPNYENVVNGDATATRLFNESIDYIESFIQKLEKSKKEKRHRPDIIFEPPNSYSMMSHKRLRGDESSRQFKTSRLYVNAWREYFTISSMTPDIVGVFFRTFVDEEHVNRLFAGQSLPWHQKSSSHLSSCEQFMDAMRKAKNMPSVEILVDRIYTTVLFDNCHSESNIRDRVNRISERLQDQVYICHVNMTWTHAALVTITRDQIVPIYTRRVISL